MKGAGCRVRRYPAVAAEVVAGRVAVVSDDNSVEVPLIKDVVCHQRQVDVIYWPEIARRDDVERVRSETTVQL